MSSRETAGALALVLSLALALAACGSGDDDASSPPALESAPRKRELARRAPAANSMVEVPVPPAPPPAMARPADSPAREEILRDQARRQEGRKLRLAEEKAVEAIWLARSIPDPAANPAPDRAQPALGLDTARIRSPQAGGEFEVEGEIDLPDGTLVDLAIHYGGRPIPALRGRGKVADGRFRGILGPAPGELLSGIYEVVATFDYRRQPAGLRTALRERLPEGVIEIVTKRELAIQPERAAEHAGSFRENLTLLSETSRTLYGEILAEYANQRERYDRDRWSAWRTSFEERVNLELERRHEAFASSIAMAPEPELLDSIPIIASHLHGLADSWTREFEGSSDEEAREEDSILRPADRKGHVERLLRAIALYLGESTEPDLVVLERIGAELAAAIDDLEARARRAEPDRRASFEAWSKRAAAVGEGTVLTRESQGRYLALLEIRRRVLEAATIWAAGADLPDLAAARGELAGRR